MRGAHAASLAQWRAELRTCELRRLAQYEMLQERERAQQAANAAAATTQHEMIREARATGHAARADAENARAELALSKAEADDLKEQLSFLRSALSSGVFQGVT